MSHEDNHNSTCSCNEHHHEPHEESCTCGCHDHTKRPDDKDVLKLVPASELPGQGLQFPCEFRIKAFGKQNATFHEHVHELVRKHAPDFDPQHTTITPSPRGNYISVTVKVQAESQEQLDNIYRELQQDPLVVYAL